MQRRWSDPPALVVQVGTTKLSYQLRAIDDCHVMLRNAANWMPLGNADEGKPVKEGTVEAWARDARNPIGGCTGLRKGYRGRFANYVPPVMQLLGLVELEHGPPNNRTRAIVRGRSEAYTETPSRLYGCPGGCAVRAACERPFKLSGVLNRKVGSGAKRQMLADPDIASRLVERHLSASSS